MLRTINLLFEELNNACKGGRKGEGREIREGDQGEGGDKGKGGRQGRREGQVDFHE